MGLNWGAVAAGVGAGLITGNPLVGAAVYGGMSSVDAAESMNKANTEATNAQNAANIAMQKETNTESIELANTAHQREVADLKAAGLNPILSAKYGGASTPSLTSPSGVAPHVESLAPVYESSGRAMSEALLNQKNLLADLAVKKAQVSATSAQAVKTGLEAKRQALENDVIENETEKRKYEEKRRVSRPQWQKNLGIDVQDAVGSVLGPVFKLFK